MLERVQLPVGIFGKELCAAVSIETVKQNAIITLDGFQRVSWGRSALGAACAGRAGAGRCCPCCPCCRLYPGAAARRVRGRGAGRGRHGLGVLERAQTRPWVGGLRPARVSSRINELRNEIPRGWPGFLSCVVEFVVL